MFRGRGYDRSARRYYARRIKPGLRVIGLDACLPLEAKKWGGVLPKEQLRWLDRQLTRHKNELNLVFMHHNFVRWTPDERPGGGLEGFCIDNDAEVRKLLSRHAPAAPVVISGHRHIGLNLQTLGGVSYFVVPSVVSHPMRYSVFTISNESIAWKTPMVCMDESAHLEARRNLLDELPWRPASLSARNAKNDAAMLALHENNSMILGKKALR